jgi:predicted outer membrane repeat protein
MIKKSVLIYILFFLSLPTVARAAVFNVSTIGELETALATARSNEENDTINISAGTYTVTSALTYVLLVTDDPLENYALTIQSTGGEVILDGQSSLQVLRIHTLVGGKDTSNADITIEGITFRDGRISIEAIMGAGLFVRTNSSDIIVRDCKFTGNVASAIYQDPSAAGAFIRADGSGTSTITGNTFSDNRANTSGGGLYTLGSIILTNNIFSNNDATVSGGGAHVEYTTALTVTNNTFSGNESSWSSGKGGGLYVRLFSDTDTANIYNNIIWGNTTGGSGADLYLADDGDNNGTGATVNFYNNDYTDLDYDDGDNLSQGDNIDQDPLFSNNLRIKAGSPCINAGLDAAPSAPADDIDDQARISPADIGADEYVPSADILVSPRPVAFGNVTVDTSSTKTVTFSNIGVLDLAISNIQISGADAGNFTLDVNGGSNPCGSTSPTIAAAGNATLTITFTPSTADSKSASLDITSNDPDEATANVSLSGTGIASINGGSGGGGGGCFINTIAYRSPMPDKVESIYNVRNNCFNNRAGKIFLKWYYKVSPFFTKLMK